MNEIKNALTETKDITIRIQCHLVKKTSLRLCSD